MTDKFIELNRSFSAMPKDFSPTEDAYESEMTFGFSESKKWDDLLKLPRVIILAEAGAGKTEEIRATSKKLLDDGKRTFFLRLEHLSSDFEEALEVGSYDEFEDWLNSDEMGWFFLDSVDEARLRGPKQFDAAIRNFARKLDKHKQRAYIYITSRVSEWRAQSDLFLIKDKLPFRELLSTENRQENELSFEDGASSSAVSLRSKDEPKFIEPEVFVLRPLELSQMRTFAEAYGVQNVDIFMAAIEKAEAEVFYGRPMDLLDLIPFWKRHGEIGNRSKMIQESINAKLIERDPDRPALSYEDTLYGVQTLAAASTFMKKSRILVPDTTTDPELKLQTIDAKSALPSWDSTKLNALLQLPIFDGAIYGAVRFHHRSVREYLTAQWLHDLLQKEKSRRSIENLFFAERYGRKVLVPSMRPILAWLILFDDRLRGKAIEIAPEIAIQDGDPSALPLEIRKNFLEKFCSHYSDQGARYLSFDISELKRFAHPDLAETVSHLLETYSEHMDIRHLLLRMIWQGEIHTCAEKAFAFAVDNNCDVYTRINGIRAVAVAGSNYQKTKLVEVVLSDPSLKNEKLIGELIISFAPEFLDIQGILTLVQRVEHRDSYSNVEISLPLDGFSRNKCPVEHILQWIRGLIPLIKKPPVIERRYYELSKQYSWLLPCAVLSAERLVARKHSDALDDSILEIISLAQSNISGGEVYIDKNNLKKLIPQWWELNKALFWLNVTSTRSRLKEGERLTEYWQVCIYDHFWSFNKTDFNRTLEDVSNKSNMDDRLVALSLTFELYRDGGSSQDRLDALNRTVKGVPELEVALDRFRNPPPISEEYLKFQREIAGENEQRNREDAENRRKWREELQGNPSLLRNTSIASNGEILRTTHYLMERLRRLGDNKWGNPHWEALIPEFGNEVAEAYRDGCTDYWRKYRPRIMSEGIENPNSTPYAVIVGLSGLSMEAQHIENWPENLTEEEAALACRYAVNELNGFPDWLQKLHDKFPKTVGDFLLTEIEWEFAQYGGETNCNYVLADVDWQLNRIKPELSAKTLELLAKYEPKHDDTVQKGLGIVLSDTGLDKDRFLEIVKGKAKGVTGARLAIWLATWMIVEAEGAYEALKSTLEKIDDPTEATSLAMHFVSTLVGGWRGETLGEQISYKKVKHLLPLYKLMCEYIRNPEDINRAGTGVYSPDLRDHAQDGRNHLFNLLNNTPGKESYLALMDLSQHHPDKRSKLWFEECAKQRAEKDSEAEPWKSEDIVSFSRDAEKPAQNHRELFDLTVARLLDLKADLEGGDSSEAPILKDVKGETKHRNVIGRWLRDRSQGRYSVPQEEELADGKKPDIRVHGAGFDGPVPIELKIADNDWTAAQLLERLNNQLCGDYLRDIRSNSGIYLLVYRGEKTYWEHPETKEHLDFDKLIQLLETEADNISASHEKVEAIRVIGIDLTKRTSPSVA